MNRHDKRRHFELDGAHMVRQCNVPGDIDDQNEVQQRPELKPNVSKGDRITLGD